VGICLRFGIKADDRGARESKAKSPTQLPTNPIIHQPEPPTLYLPLEQMMAIQTWVAQGLDRAAETLREIHAVDSEIEVRETRCCTLADFAAAGLYPPEQEVVAGVLVSLQGGLNGAALLAMAPEDALAWSRCDATGSDPIKRFMELGRRVLDEVVESACEALGVACAPGEASLQEGLLVGCLLETHAPSDTAVVCSRYTLYAGRQEYGGYLYLLVEPKRIAALLAALCVSLQ